MSDMVEHSLLFLFPNVSIYKMIPIENMLSDEDPTPDRSEVGLVNRESNEDVPAGSTRSVPSQALANICSNNLEINRKKTTHRKVTASYIYR